MAGQQYFADALQLLRIGVEATGAGREVLERWTAHARQEPAHGDEVSPPPAAEVEVEVEASSPPRAGPEAPRQGAGDDAAAARPDGQPGSRRRRRRRGGKRRRRRGGQDAGAGGAPSA